MTEFMYYGTRKFGKDGSGNVENRRKDRTLR